MSMTITKLAKASINHSDLTEPPIYLTLVSVDNFRTTHGE
jgi:hypothetical protein